MQYLVGALDKAKELNVEVVTIFPSMIAGMTAEEIDKIFSVPEYFRRGDLWHV